MAGKRWTEAALEAVSNLNRAEDWAEFHALFPNVTFDSWEVKRRRVQKAQDARRTQGERAAMAELLEERLSHEEQRVSYPKPSYVPHLGEGRQQPEYSGFRTAFLDIEATDLKANFGRLLCLSVADQHSTSRDDVVTFRWDDPEFAGRNRRDDSLLAAAIRDYLDQFDVWVGWNSKRYDIPFINTRLALHDLRPLRADIMHIDPMYTSRHSMRLHSSRLDAVAKTFRLDDQKTPLDPEIWAAAADGEREAMDYVVMHCEQDVLVLRHAFHVLKPFIRNVHR